MAWSGVILHARLIFFTDHAAAEPLADARGTLGFRGTPVENYWRRLCPEKEHAVFLTQ